MNLGKFSWLDFISSIYFCTPKNIQCLDRDIEFKMHFQNWFCNSFLKAYRTTNLKSPIFNINVEQQNFYINNVAQIKIRKIVFFRINNILHLIKTAQVHYTFDSSKDSYGLPSAMTKMPHPSFAGGKNHLTKNHLLNKSASFHPMKVRRFFYPTISIIDLLVVEFPHGTILYRPPES